MACSVNFSKRAVIRRPHAAFRLTVDLQTRAVTNVEKGVAATEPRAFAGLLLEQNLRLCGIPSLPQIGCFTTHAGVVLLPLPRLRRDDRNDDFIALMLL